MEPFKMPFGKYQGLPITSRKIPKIYLVELEEYLLLVKKENTSAPIMKALDKELKRREK
jgi:uncharacterized protein (DUF3820 family)